MSEPLPAEFGVHLRRADERSDEVRALTRHWGGAVGLRGVLADLNRTAQVERVPARAEAWGFRLDVLDDRSRRWWPQGITTSADHAADGLLAGRSVVLTSAYSKEVDRLRMGARITVTDVTDRDRVRYRHVLLVEATADADGELRLRPVEVHAGGLVWHGRHLHVAATARGLATFRLDDILEVPPGGASDRLGLTREGADAFGYRYVLPLRFRYVAGHAAAVTPIRYSFLSLDRSTTPYQLVAGEYGRGRATTRLVRYALDPTTSLLATGPGNTARPLDVDLGVQGMQGVVVVAGRHYVATSAGAYRRGSLWVGRPGALSRRAGVLPVGPEDLAYEGATDRLWTVSEHPGRRYVVSMPRGQFD
jgi:hypothetical protein